MILEITLVCVLQNILEGDIYFTIVCWLWLFLVLISTLSGVRSQLYGLWTVHVQPLAEVCNHKRTTKGWTSQVFLRGRRLFFLHTWSHADVCGSVEMSFPLLEGAHFVFSEWSLGFRSLSFPERRCWRYSSPLLFLQLGVYILGNLYLLYWGDGNKILACKAPW